VLILFFFALCHLTCESHDNVVVEEADFANRSVLLQLGNGLLLHAEDDALRPQKEEREKREMKD
jgi:hypothetical protein